MLRSGIRKILRDIASRKFRTFLVSASIFVGVLGVIALFTASNLISQQLESDIDQKRLSMIDLRVSVANDAVLDNELYLQTLNQQNEAGRAIQGLDSIETVEGWAYYPVAFKKPNETRFQDAELRSYSAPLQELKIEPMRLLEGDWAEVGTNEVMLETRMAEKNGFKVGDQIVFRSVSAQGTSEAAYAVSGIVFHPYSTSGLTNDLPGPELGIYAQYADAQGLLSFNGFTNFVARYQTFDLAEEHLEGFVSAVAQITPYVPLQPGIEDPAKNAQVEGANIFIGILNILALATVIVSGFLVVNVINTIVVEQRQQIGILKSLGATQWENFAIYAGIAFVYGLFGTLAAILPGILAGQAITNYLAPTLDVRITGFHWSPSAVFLGAVMGLLVPSLAAVIPVFFAVRISIMQAITDLGIRADYGEGFIPRLILRLPIPISMRQSLSNVYQKRWRLVLTGMTLTLTVATFMATLAVTISISKEIRNIFDRLGYHILVVPNEIQDYDTMRTTLENVDGVDHVAPAALVFVQMPGDYVNFFTGDNQVQIFGLDPTSDTLRFDYQDGEGWSKDPNRKGIVISQAISNKLNLKAGDILSLTVGGKPHDVDVLAIDSNAWDSANMRWDDIAELAGLVRGAPTPNGYIVNASAENTDETVMVVGMDETLLTLLVPGLDSANTGAILSGDLAQVLDLQEGDSLHLTINGEDVERRVSAVVPNALLEANAAQVNPQFSSLPPYLVLFGFNDLVGITGADTTGEPTPNAYYVTVSQSDPASEDVDKVIDDVRETLLDQGIGAQYINQIEQGDLTVANAQQTISVFLVAAILIAAVGAIGLLTTLTISVFERQKEIGVMRSIGAGSGLVATQFMTEGIIVGVASWVAGLPLSYLMALGFNAAAKLDNIPFTYPPIVLVIGLVGMVVIAAVASLGPSLSAARKTVSDILRYQ